MEINLNNLFHACDGQVSLKTLDDESLDVLLLFESSLNWNEYFYWTTNELSVSKVVLKMNFISKKNSSFFIPPCHPPYKSFSTRFSVVHTRSCFSNTKFEWIIRGEEDRIVGHRSLDNGLLIRSIHLPQILSPRFIQPHHVYHVPFYRTSELRSLSNPPLTCW